MNPARGLTAAVAMLMGIPVGVTMLVALTVAGASPAAPAAAVATAVGIPPIMAFAYQQAAQLAQVDGCRLRWTVLAAIGRIESGHAAGRAINPTGDITPSILGPVLDGNGFAAIPDTDNARWDGNPIWDRAVGPMQFIPSSWTIFGRDGNNDGRIDPNNAYDATLAAAAHLCGPGPNDLTEPARLHAAIYGYNHDQSYVEAVLTQAARYDQLIAAAAHSAGATVGGFVLPVDRSWIDPDPSVLMRPHHDYPAWDLALPEGTPVYAVTAGAITTVNDTRCGLGIQLTQPDGHRWTFCHATRLLAASGQQVTAGQLIMLSGNTGNSTGPHLHLALNAPDGVALCPQPLLDAWWNGTAVGPDESRTVGTVGCSY